MVRSEAHRQPAPQRLVVLVRRRRERPHAAKHPGWLSRWASQCAVASGINVYPPRAGLMSEPSASQAMSWSAYVDESQPDPRADPGAYLLAAAMLPTEDLQAARAAVRSLLLRGQRKLHWRDENEQRRKLLTAAVADIEALHLVVVRVDLQASSERRRRLCLRRLLCELDAAGVAQVHLEAREARQNGRDLQLLGALRAQQAIGPTIRMHHQPGPSEPLLWMPDLVAGAVGAARQGRVAYRVQLDGVLTVLQT